MPKNKILIVDDEPDTLDTLAAILRARKYEVMIASSGAEGIEKAKKEKPDLILLDILMPNIDGYEVCTRLKLDKDTSKIPIIMLTAFSESSAIQKAYKVKADDYIIKPFSFPILFGKLGKFLT
jgi:CheY-like chemotaxis protein